MWSLQYIDATNTLQTVTFAQLAALEGGKVIADAWLARFQSHKASTVTLRLPGVPPSVAPAIPFESRISIIGPTGTVFQGLRTDRTGTADPRRASSSYQFDDEWYFLDHCPFQQMWVRVASPGGPTTPAPFSSVVLYQPNPGQVYVPAPIEAVINTGQQIVDILNWAISLGANLQIGEIDPALYQAWYPVQNIKCGDALRMCLRLHPDCFTEIDYSTNPPTFHARVRTNLVGVTLPYAYTDASGRRHVATDIQPRPELQPRRVALFYRVVENNYVISTPVDIWPMQNLSVQGPVITGQSVGGAAAPYVAGGLPNKGTAMTGITGSAIMTIPVGSPGGLRALDFAIDLQGPKMTVSNAAIRSAAFDPTNLAWWQKKVPSLKVGIPSSGAGALALLSSVINGSGATAITVLDDKGNPVNLTTYAYELYPQSSPMAWMTVAGGGALQVIEATVTAHFTYTKSKAVGTGTLAIKTPNDHVHHVRVKLCNSASMSQSFTQALTTGESIPPNLAQTVYNSLAALQYSFTHTLVERPFNGWLKPGKHAINLGGAEAAPAWATMNATLQQTEYKMHLDGAGNAFDNFTVKCGPVEHLEPGQLIQLFNVFNNRDLTKVDTNERLTGVPTPGNTVAMPDDGDKENSVPAEADEGWQVFSAPDATTGNTTNSIQMNPAIGQATVAQLDSAAGTVLNTATVMAELTGAGAPGAGTLA
jgi:hypothetical protein